MRLKRYKTADGGTEVISHHAALVELRSLGYRFAVGLAEYGHHTSESNLMSGLAAYHILDLKGTDPRLDAAHAMVIKSITDVMFERARAAAHRASTPPTPW